MTRQRATAEAAPMDCRCSRCSQLIPVTLAGCASRLVEITCARCGHGDVYPVSCLRPRADAADTADRAMPAMPRHR